MDALPDRFKEWTYIYIESTERILVAKAWENSNVEAWENSNVEAFQFSMIAVMTSAVVIKHLADFAVASIRGVDPKIEKKDDTATIVETPKMNDLKISFETWLERGWVVADGIHKKLIARKKLGEIEVFTVEEFTSKTESFVVKKGDLFSHGETVEKAIEDLRFKISDRDTSKYEHWKDDPKAKISVDEAIQGYRVITGACEFGTKEFVNGLGEIPKMISPIEILKRTEGAFGNELLKAFLAI